MSAGRRPSPAVRPRLPRTRARLAAILAPLLLPGSVAAEDTTLRVEQIGTWRPEHLLLAGFCLLGGLILTFQFILFLRARDSISANDIMRGFSVPLILVGVVALLALGYDEKQMQPVIALFSTVLGWLLGRVDRRDPARPARPPTN